MEKTALWVLFIVMILAILLILAQQLKSSNDAISEGQRVNFCGVEYEAPITVVEGIDIIKQIAEMASAEEGGEICRGINSVDGHSLAAEIKKELYSPGWYTVYLNDYLFRFDSNKQIFYKPGESGIYPWIVRQK